VGFLAKELICPTGG